MFIGFGIASILTDPNKDGIDGIPDIPVKVPIFILLFSSLNWLFIFFC